MGSKEATCMPIYKNCGGEDGEVFQQSDGAQIYEKGLKFFIHIFEYFSDNDYN